MYLSAWLPGKKAKSTSATNRWDLSKLKNPITQAAYSTEVARILGEKEETMNIDGEASALGRALKRAAGKKLKMERVPRKPWITQTTLQLVEQKRKAKGRCSQTKEDREKYRQLCKEVKKATKENKQAWINEQCQRIDQHHSQGRMKEAHKLIRLLTTGLSSKTRRIKDKNGKMLTTEGQIQSRWTEYSRELYQDKKSYEPVTLERLAKRCAPAEPSENQTIQREEIERAVHRLKDGKTPGDDGIPAELIKAGGEETIKAIHNLCNMVWEQEKWPVEWTRAVLVTIPKKGDLTECANYRTIALISHLSKVILMVILDRINAVIQGQLSEEQGGFRKDRGTIQQILTLRLIAEKYLERNRQLYNCFVDYTKAFDSVWHDGLWAVMRSYTVPEKVVNLLSVLYSNAQLAVRINGQVGDWFTPEIGSRQGDPISPVAFITLLERVMETTECETERIGANIHGTIIKDLRYADDIDLMAESMTELKTLISKLQESSNSYGLKINANKTKVMVFERQERKRTEKIEIDGHEIEYVTEFIYLGSLVTANNDCSPEIRRRINLANQSFARLRTIWQSSDVQLKTKLDLLRVCVFSRLLYAAETWTLKSVDERRLLAFEMKCYRRLLKIRWQDKVTNASIRERLQRNETVVDTVKRRKLQLFGHICRMPDDRLPKTVMLGMVNGSRPRGRPPRRWSDDIADWCGCDLPETVRLTQNRRQWCELIEKTVTGLNGPPGL